jgi:hypothetical protein
MAPARFFEMPCFLAMLACTDLKPGCAADFLRAMEITSFSTSSIPPNAGPEELELYLMKELAELGQDVIRAPDDIWQ